MGHGVEVLLHGAKVGGVDGGGISGGLMLCV